MNFKELATNYLVENAMWPQQADEVWLAYMEAAGSSLKDCWHKDTSGYPKQMENVTIMGINFAAVDYLRKNQPLAFYLPIFMMNTGKEEWNTLEKAAAIQTQWAEEAKQGEEVTE